MLSRFEYYLDKKIIPLLQWPASLALFSMMVVTVVDVVGRGVFNSPLVGSIELTQVTLAVMIFCIFPVVSWNEEQISVDLFDKFIPAKVVPWRQMLINLAGAVGMYYLAMQLLSFAERSARYGDVTEFLKISMSNLLYCMVATALLSSLICLLKGLSYFIKCFSPKGAEQ